MTHIYESSSLSFLLLSFSLDHPRIDEVGFSTIDEFTSSVTVSQANGINNCRTIISQPVSFAFGFLLLLLPRKCLFGANVWWFSSAPYDSRFLVCGIDWAVDCFHAVMFAKVHRSMLILSEQRLWRWDVFLGNRHQHALTSHMDAYRYDVSEDELEQFLSNHRQQDEAAMVI